MHVVNFDLPDVEHGGIEEYVHRIGDPSHPTFSDQALKVRNRSHSAYRK